MRVIRDAEQSRMPWKNGGGETIEIARGPEGSSLDTFEWRISRARIDRPGAFSRFDGIDRTLAVLDGEGVLLSLEGRRELCLTVQSPPFFFDGGASIQSRLLNGPVTDLNVMTKRGRLSHGVVSLPARTSTRVSGASGIIVVLFSTGRTLVETSHSRVHIERNDAAILAAEDETVITPEDAGHVYRIDIRSVIGRHSLQAPDNCDGILTRADTSRQSRT